jgi:hypothetical protein
MLGSYTMFSNTLTGTTNLTAVPGCRSILYEQLFTVRSQWRALRFKITAQELLFLGDSEYAFERKKVLKHISVPLYQGTNHTRLNEILLLCNPGLYAFQAGLLDYKAADPYPVCVDTRAMNFLPWYSWMLCLIVMGCGFQFLANLHSLVGKVEAVATVLGERQSWQDLVGEAVAAPPPTSRPSSSEETPLLAFILGKGVGRRNRAGDLKKPV